MSNSLQVSVGDANLSKPIDLRDVKMRMATTLAPMLLAISVFSLAAVNSVPTGAAKDTLVDEIFSLVAAFCIFASTLLIDFILDEMVVSNRDRIGFLNYGYISFCLAVGAMTMSVPILYLSRQNQINIFNQIGDIFLFFLAGCSVIAKMMILKDREICLSLILFFFVVVIVRIYNML